MGKKISNKIILCVVTCSVLISAVVGITAIKESTIVIKDEAYGKILSIAESKGNKYSIEIQKTENTVKEYAQVISDSIDMSKVNDAKYMNSFQSQFATLTKSIGVSNNDIVGLYINFNPELTGGQQPYDLAYFYDERTNQREIYYNSYKISDYHQDNKELFWYYDPIKEKGGVWSKPYVDPESNNIKMISYTMPVYKNDQLIGVAGLDIGFENLQEMISGTKIYDTGNAFLLDKDYTFIVDKDKTLEDNLGTMKNGQYNNLVDEMKNNKESYLEVNFEGKETLIGYSTLSNGQIIGIRVPAAEVFSGMKRITYIMVAVIAVGMILSSILGLFISRKISIPIEAATRFIKRLANLDLTDSEQSIYKMRFNKDETGTMIESLIQQRDELIKIVKVLKRNSLEVLQHTNIISTAESETVESITMMADVMEKLLERASEQARAVRIGSSKLDNLAEEIEESVDSITELAENAIELQRMQEQGSQSIYVLGEKLTSNIKSFSSIDNNIDEVLKNSELLEELLSTTKLIYGEINSLAIDSLSNLQDNDEEVKEKIKELSEKADESLNKMEEIINKNKEDATLGKKNMEKSKHTSQEVDRMMGWSTESIDGIATSINNIMQQIKNLVVSINKLNKDKDGVLASIEEISLITDEVAVSAENVTASIGEQEVAMKSTSERTKELKKVSEVLGNVVEKFKV